MKLFKNLFLMALALFTFNACDDVPAPYTFPGDDSEDIELSENLLENSDFETWTNNKPDSWATNNQLNSADIEQSTDAQSGTSAVIVKGYTDKNKRFASKNYFLLPGTYYISAFTKQCGDTPGQYRIGYMRLTDGVPADYTTDYVYLTTAATVESDWSEATASFTIAETTEVSIMVVNAKNEAPILVDNVTLKTTNGGLTEGDAGSSDDGNDDGNAETPAEGTIAAVIAAGKSDAASIQGTIIATYARGFLVNDGTGSILVYLGSDAGHQVGDVVKVSGATSTFGGLLQFGTQPTVEKTGTATVETPVATVWTGSDLDAHVNSPEIIYVQYTGKLIFKDNKYYNVEVEGASTAVGSIAYPLDGTIDASLIGQNVTVTGYTIGVTVSNTVINTMATSVVAAGGTTTPDTDDTTGDNSGNKDNEDGNTDDTTGEGVIFDFTNPVALTPSITPNEVGADATQGVETRFDENTPFTNNGYSITFSTGSASNPVRFWTRKGGDIELRTYGGSTITISAPDGKNISNIIFSGYKVQGMTASTGSFSNGEWTGNTNSVTFNVTETLNIETITIK